MDPLPQLKHQETGDRNREGLVMAKNKHKKRHKHDEATQAHNLDRIEAKEDSSKSSDTKMREKEFQKAIRPLHGELVALQDWVLETGAKIIVIFEGRDTAGKGGTIKALTERVSPRVFRVVALPAPTEREKTQMYIQRYLERFPAAGEIVIFDRSWYNRAGVERVMGFCTPEQTNNFLNIAPAMEKAIVDSGIIILKYWLEVSADEQTKRLTSRLQDPRKTWKLSTLDLQSYTRWYEYGEARDAMFDATHTGWAPWHVAHTDDKKRGRLNIISHLLSSIPYAPAKPLKVELPERQLKVENAERDLANLSIPAVF